MKNFGTPYLPNGLTNFDKITCIHSIPKLDEMARFSRLQDKNQGHSEMKYLSELLWQAETSTLMLGH